MHLVGFSLSYGTAEKQTKQKRIPKNRYHFNVIRAHFIVPEEQDACRCFCKSLEEFTCIFSYKH